jgi:SAM-dependent methyltransferase
MQTTAQFDQGAKDAYEAIAPIYDLFTAHHDYELWLNELLPQLRRHGLTKGRLLDIACGTGKSFLPMLARGWDVAACDISPKMVALARAKIGSRVRLTVADMRELPRIGEFDLAWCLDDAVNYLLSADELLRALKGMRENLDRKGLLLFDVNTLHSYNTFFSQTDTVEDDGGAMVWHGLASGSVAPGSICEANFRVETSVSGVPAHTHRQRHFPEAEMLDALDEAGLECLDVFGHGYDAVLEQPLNEAVHTKTVYIARRVA